ncbi:MAG TPA: hypothetical protein VFC34_03220 [Puia sp.]|nr:hypothetical protein [Puia sp.]
MSFTISKIKEQDLNLLQLTDDTSGIHVKILPGWGALLHEFSIPLKEGRLQAVSSYRDLSDLRQNHPLFFRSAKLSPFPCRIAGARYKFEEKWYEFKNKFKDGSAIHGLLSDKPFTIVKENADDHQASVLLEYGYNGEEQGYPFPYLLTVRYTLKEKGLLALESVVTNRSPGRIPIADGWHPYFSIGGKVDDCELTIDAREILVFDENMVPTGERTAFDRFSSGARLGTYALDHCFLPEFHPGRAACTLLNPVNRVAISFFPDKTYPYLQIYTPDDRNSIAIENLSAAPNSLNNGIGLIILEPGHSQTFTTQYKLGLQ